MDEILKKILNKKIIAKKIPDALGECKHRHKLHKSASNEAKITTKHSKKNLLMPGYKQISRVFSKISNFYISQNLLIDFGCVSRSLTGRTMCRYKLEAAEKLQNCW